MEKTEAALVEMEKNGKGSKGCATCWFPHSCSMCVAYLISLLREIKNCRFLQVEGNAMPSHSQVV